MKALIIDLAAAGEWRVLHARLGTTVTVLAATHVQVPAGADPLPVLAEKLRAENLTGLPALVVLPRQLVSEHTFHLPPMPARDIRKVLPREIAASTQAGEVVFGFRLGGRVVERQAEKVEVSCFYADKAMLFDYLHRLREAGVRPVRLLPEAEALMAVLQAAGDALPAPGLMLAEVRGNKIGIHLFRNRHWALEREFQFRTEGEETSSEDDLARIQLEVNRTVQFFKQKNRGFTVESALLYGSGADLGVVSDFMTNGLRLDCRPAGRSLFRQRLLLPRTVTDEGEFVSLFLVALGAALAGTQKGGVNLLASEFVEREQTGRRLLGLGISGALIAALLAGGTIYLERIRAEYRSGLETMRKAYGEMGRDVSQLEEVKRQRARYFRSQLFIAYPRQYAFALADFVRRLSLACSPGIELLSLAVESEPPLFRFKLEGRIRSVSGIDAQSTFITLFERIKAFDSVSQITSSGVKVSAAQVPPGQEAPLEGSELLFAVSGSVDVE